MSTHLHTASEFTRLSIEGMHCAACVLRLEKVLQRQAGVLSATVNLATESALIEHTPDWQAQSSIAAIQKAGFEAHQASSSAVTASAGPDGTAPRMGKSLWPVLLSLLAALLLMLPMLTGQPEWPAWLQFMLCTPVQFGSGSVFLRGAIGALRSRQATMDVLVALGSLTAWTWSTVIWLSGAAGHLFYEASASVIAFVLLGKWLERRTRDQTAQAISGLSGLRPDTVNIVVPVEGSEPGPHSMFRTVPLAVVQPGDVLRINPTTRIACDGTVLFGSSHVDESALTGESVPLSRSAGDAVHAGTLNIDGVLFMRVARTGEQTLLGQVIRLIEKAQGQKLPAQALADRIAAVFVPAVLLVALATFTLLLFIGAGFETAMLRAVTVVVIACPCALGLATPAAIIAGTGAAARAGLLIRDPRALHVARSIDTLVFDKTGTLTIGQPLVQNILLPDETPSANGSGARQADDNLQSGVQCVESQRGVQTQQNEPALTVTCSNAAASALRIAAGLQTGRAHPLGHALQEAALRQGLTVQALSDIRLLPGIGVEGRLGKRWLLCHVRHALGLLDAKEQQTLERLVRNQASNAGALTTNATDPRPPNQNMADQNRGDPNAATTNTPDSGTLSVLLAEEEPGHWRVSAVFVFSDQIRTEAPAVLQTLKSRGQRLILLSGDRQAAVDAIAQRLPLDEAIGECSPADKAERIGQLQRDGHRVAMVGDGVNDAPAMALADLAIAMGSGTDIAAQTAHITLMNSQLTGVAASLDIASRIHRNISENLFWAFAYNTVCIPLAAIGWFNPMMAALAMALSSVSVVMNALRLTRWQPRQSD